MNAVKARTAFILGLGIVGLFAATLGIAVYHRDPTTCRTTWCPEPEDRSMSDRSLTRAQVLARLREVRARLAEHRDEKWLHMTRDDNDRALADIDELLFNLIVDYDLATTPTMEARP